MAKINGVETIIAVPIPEPEIIWGPLMIANTIRAKNMNIGTIKYFVDWGSEPGIWEGFIDVINWLTIFV